jgi:hypothetical protein
LVSAPALLAQNDPPQRARETPRSRPVAHRQYHLGAPAEAHGRIAPLNESVSSVRLVKYNLQSDVPHYDQNFNGNGVTVAADEVIPRNYYGIGMEGGRMQGGGCFPVDPSTTACLREPDANGNLVTVQKARERWTFRISYIDPSDPTASEFNVGFDTTGFGGGGDSIWEWERRTPKGHSCFTFYEDICDTYGLNLNTLEGTAQWFTPQCFLKLGAGYHAYLFYQYSRYNFGDTIPPGAEEWVPNTPATTTRLEVPGKTLSPSTDWQLGRSENALAITGAGLVHPRVDATGYSGIHDPLNLGLASFPGGSETIEVVSYDCGVIPNVSFTIAREFIEHSGGHNHAGSPPLNDVSSLDTYTGTTDRNGHWSTALHAGPLAGTMRYTISTTNLQGQPFTGQPLLVTTGFIGLVDPGANDPNIRYTGVLPAHPSSHWGAPELHAFVRDLAAQYNARKQPVAQGSLGLNDMSITTGGVFDYRGTWSPPHGQHSFGVACDIDHAAVRFSDGQNIPVDYWGTLTTVATDLGGFLLIERQNNDNLHVQIPEAQISDVLLRETR